MLVREICSLQRLQQVVYVKNRYSTSYYRENVVDIRSNEQNAIDSVQTSSKLLMVNSNC